MFLKVNSGVSHILLFFFFVLLLLTPFLPPLYFIHFFFSFHLSIFLFSLQLSPLLCNSVLFLLLNLVFLSLHKSLNILNCTSNYKCYLSLIFCPLLSYFFYFLTYIVPICCAMLNNLHDFSNFDYFYYYFFHYHHIL